MMRRSTMCRVSQFGMGHANLSAVFAGSTPVTSVPIVDKGVKVSSTPNGARLITHDKQGAQQSVGVYIEAGAKFDPLSAPGINYVMRWAMTTSNMQHSLFQIDRNVRAQGSSSSHTEIRKRYLGWKIESQAEGWKKPVEDIMTCIVAPRFPEYDVERFRDTMDNILQELRWNEPREYVINQLETVAYYREALGAPRFVAPAFNDECSHKALINQWAQLCLPTRVTIAGVNVDHNELAAVYENAPYPHSAAAPHHANSQKQIVDQLNESAQYYGGYERDEQESRPKEMTTKPDMEEETIVAVGYQANGFDGDRKQYAASLVVQAAIDMTFQSGIHYDHSLTHHGLRSFYRPFATTGLVGFTLRADPALVATQLDGAMKAVKAIKVDKAMLAAAQERAAVAFFNESLEMNGDYCDFLGTSLTKGTARVTPEEILASIQAVTVADANAAVKMMNGAKPTKYSTGCINGVPSLKQLGY